MLATAARTALRRRVPSTLRLLATASASRRASTLTLNTGQVMPAIGFGTWQDKDAQEGAVLEALKAGYRHIDTASIYGTEPAVGSALRQSGVDRGAVFLTTKLWNHEHHPEDVGPALDASLKALGTDYVDLYLMHWPVAWQRGGAQRPVDSDGNVIADSSIDFLDTYRAMEEQVGLGKARAIGVSNFSRGEMEHLIANVGVVPAAHQFELHPYLQQREFCEWHAKQGIAVVAYSPFGNANPVYDKGAGVGKLVEDPVLVEIANKYNVSAAQVALAWGIASGHAVLPKSKTPSRISANLAADFRLKEEDLSRIAELDRRLRFNDPSAKFGWNFYEDLDGKE